MKIRSFKQKLIKSGVILLALVLLLSILSMSCSSGSSTVTTAITTTATSTTAVTSTATATTTTTATVKPIIIRLAPTTTGPPPAMGITLVATEMARILEERTNGRVKFQIYWSETLAKGTELVSAVQSGIADMAYLRTFAEPGKMPLSTVGELPGITTNNWVGCMAYNDLIHQEPILSEMAKYNMKPYSTFGILYQQVISKQPIRSLAEMKGKKIAASGVAAKVWSELGATVLSMSPTEQYDGLSKGTIDAISVPKDAIKTFKFYEAGKYFVNIYTVPRLHPTVFNQKFWDSLPADIQKIFTDAVPDLIKSAYECQDIQTADAAWKEMQAANVEVIEWSADDLAKINQVTGSYADTWARETDAKGLAGTKLVSDYRVAAAKYETLNPFK